jgi:hypothetical protein
MGRRFQFSLRALLVACGFAALVCQCISSLRYDYLAQLRTVNSVLAEFPEIDKVWLCTNDDVTLEVEGLWFSTVDQPQVVFGIDYRIDGASKSEIRRRLRQVILERRPVELPARATYRLR